MPDHMAFKYISNQSIMDLIERRVKAFAQDFLMPDPSLIIYFFSGPIENQNKDFFS